MDIKEIDFIARYYKKGKFRADSGWRHLGIASSFRIRRFRIAAAITAVVILTAAAGIIYQDLRTPDTQQQEIPAKVSSPMAEVKVMDFENMPLPEAVKRIENTYGVHVGNLPANPDEYVISLHYEGTPGDLISTINDILGTEMTVTEK